MTRRRVWSEDLRLWVIVAEDLGPCDTCGRAVRPLVECSDCLENSGAVRHLACCKLPFGGLL